MKDLAAICGTCGHDVADRDGWLHVDMIAANRAERDPAAAEVLWKVHHRRCDPNPQDDGYWIDVEQVTSRAGLLRWSAHLMAKRWLEATDWDDLLREAAGEIPPVRLRPLAGLRAA